MLKHVTQKLLLIIPSSALSSWPPSLHSQKTIQIKIIRLNDIENRVNIIAVVTQFTRSVARAINILSVRLCIFCNVQKLIKKIRKNYYAYGCFLMHVAMLRMDAAE